MRVSKIKIIEQISEDSYRSKDGYSVAREYGPDDNGNLISGKWVFRDPLNNFIDMDRDRHDLMKRNNLQGVFN